MCCCCCGVEKVILGYSLKSGHTKSCGCFRVKVCSQKGKNSPNYKHGLSYTKGYKRTLSAKREICKLNQTPDNANLQKIQLYYTILNKSCEIPMSKSGLHHEDNLQILTAEINLQKKAKWPLTKAEEIKYKGITI